ncbi:MAG: hypothetical protein KBB33_08770 [Candidatus Cloacimonetes bacterium]|nr:hypothetical protein [Candidatus Cloacimonadota bacterium]
MSKDTPLVSWAWFHSGAADLVTSLTLIILGMLHVVSPGTWSLSSSPIITNFIAGMIYLGFWMAFYLIAKPMIRSR